jgi:uncharacterized RDD family membrane protein YckC
MLFSGKRPAFCAYCGKPWPAETDEATVPADTAAEPGAGTDGDDPAEIGGYRLLRLLGEGGMGRVYEAEDIGSGRRVALKLIAARYAESPAAVERFRREGRLASCVAHPRCVFIYAADEAYGRPYIVMELMPGTTLQDLVTQQGPLSVEDAVLKVLDVIDGLRELHHLGIVHRDVKPSNCLLDARGRAKVADFGLSRSLVDSAAVTRTGTFVGTPLFAAPEQIKGGTIGPHADVYSVAATLYCLLTGRAPFQGSDAAATLARIASEPAPPMRSLRPELPAALDRVVLRGLERDPARRWRDLDELRGALLVFAPHRLSIGGLGIRVGAFFIDFALIFVMGMLIHFSVKAQSSRSFFEQQQHIDPSRQLLLSSLGTLVWLLYLGGCDMIWGCTLGKRWLGLRVVKARGGEKPPPVAIALRTIIFCTLGNLPNVGLIALIFLADVGRHPEDPARALIDSLILTGTMVGLFILSLAVGFSTMRARNGYRGLHEMLSGTRVVRLPDAAPKHTVTSEASELHAAPLDGLPDRLGPFDVVGVLGQYDSGALLLAHDASLVRHVWIWLRPVGEPPLSPARRDLGRVARLRWLTGAVHDAGQWDAFLAPDAGAAIAGAVSPALSWARTRPMLTELTEELMAAEADGSLPATLGPAQVWVRPDGRVLLLDAPVIRLAGEEDATPLAVLGQLAVWALGATPREVPHRPMIVGVPLPRHAAALLDRLLGHRDPFASVEEFNEALAATAERPMETTRPRRLAHLALLAAFVSIGMCLGFSTSAVTPALAAVILSMQARVLEQLRSDLQVLTARDAANVLTAPDPATRLSALTDAQADVQLELKLARRLETARQQQRFRLDTLSPPGRSYAEAVEKQVEATQQRAGTLMKNLPRHTEPERLRQWIGSELHDDTPAVNLGMAMVPSIAVPIFPIVWITWAFIFRGGLSFPIVGLALVRRDGRPALRIQCAWRAFVVWVPLVAFAVGSTWLDYLYVQTAQPGAELSWLVGVSLALWWGCAALLGLYVTLAIVFPKRALHDSLAGTYVVPR